MKPVRETMRGRSLVCRNFMLRVLIRHETTYLFSHPVAFGVWRLIMRPVDTHATRLVDATLQCTPVGVTRWASDVYGNSLCFFEPQGVSDCLTVVSRLDIDRYPTPLHPPERDDPSPN